MGQAAAQTKYLSKVVLFNGQKLTLFSLDGNTWSSRKLELAEIKQRQELQRAELAGKKDEAEAADAPVVAARKYDDEDAGQGDIDYDESLEKQEDPDGHPFSISDEDDQNDKAEAAPKTRVSLRGKAAGIKKLPVKPAAALKKNAAKADLKLSPKKGLSSKANQSKVNPKKEQKNKPVRVVAKKSAKKTVKAKSKKAA